MLTNGTLFILALIIGTAAMNACSERQGPANNANVTTAEQVNANRAVEPNMEGAKDNSEELATHVKMPFEPEDLAWKEYQRQDGRRLVAVFQLTEEDSKKLIESASRIRSGVPAMLSSENWFPKELTTQNEMSGGSGIQATAYPADEFFQPPYTEGTFSRVDNTNFFVLEVFAK